MCLASPLMAIVVIVPRRHRLSGDVQSFPQKIENDSLAFEGRTANRTFNAPVPPHFRRAGSAMPPTCRELWAPGRYIGQKRCGQLITLDQMPLMSHQVCSTNTLFRWCVVCRQFQFSLYWLMRGWEGDNKRRRNSNRSKHVVCSELGRHVGLYE